MLPSFGHHMIRLHPARGGDSAGKDSARLFKAACKEVETIHRVLRLAGRHELAVLSDDPDFLGDDKRWKSTREKAWELIQETPRLLWVIPTRHPENLAKLLPKTWIGKGFRNLCVAVAVDAVDLDADPPLLANKVDFLRKASVQRRMILLGPGAHACGVEDMLDRIDWLVLEGNADTVQRAGQLAPICKSADVAFLHHRMDLSRRFDRPGTEYDSTLPCHPFGNLLNLSQPPFQCMELHADDIPEEGSAVSAALVEVSATPATPPVSLLPEPSIEDALPAVATGGDFTHPSDTSDAGSSEESSDDGLLLRENNQIASAPERQDFERLDQIVRDGLEKFVAVGMALAEIRDRDLWKAGGFSSWASYCQAVAGMSKTHSNRLIQAARVAGRIGEVTPNGVTPRSESQVRPLCRLESEEQQLSAWTDAVKRSEGKQPTAKTLSDIVADLMEANPSGEPTVEKVSRKEKISGVISAIRNAVRAQADISEIDRLLCELEKLLRIGNG